MEERTSLLENVQKPIGINENGSGPWIIFFTFVNGFVGGGLLGLPYGFLNGGLIASAIGLIALSLISNYTLRLLINCKTKYHQTVIQKIASINEERAFNDEGPQSYADIGKLCFGKFGIVMVNASILVSQLGYCCAYLVFIAENINTLSFTMHIGLSFVHILLGALPILVFLTWIRDLKKLSYSSLISFCAITLSVGAVIEFGFQNVGVRSLSEYSWIKISTFPIFYGIVAFSFTIHGLVLDIHKSARDPSIFNRSMDGAMIFVTFAYILFGSLGFLFFGDQTSSIITSNLYVNVESDVIKIILSLILIFAYPLQMYPAVKIMENGIFGQPNESLSDTLKRNFFRLFVVIMTIIAAVAVPLFGLFASLVGTFSNSFIAFIYPPLFYLKLFKTSVPIYHKILCVIICIIGILGMGIGSSVTIYKIIDQLRNNE